MTTVLDILKGATLPTLSSGVGVATPTPAPALPLDTNPVLQRFRSLTGQMVNIAKESISQEINRIVALPIIGYPTEEEIDLVSKYYCPGGGLDLYPEQVNAMMQYYEYNGLIAPIPVGCGKTLISVLIANDAYSYFGKRRILLMNPPNLIDQLRDTELPYYRRHISINVPFYYLTGKVAAKRMLLAKSKRAGCYVVSYSILSSQQGAELLDAVEPDLIIGDEIHNIASANPSARGRRFKAAVKKFNPQLVGLSGTFTTKSPRDYHFIVTHALQENSPMPRPTSLAEEWAKIIDSSASGLDDLPNNSALAAGPISPLPEWAKKNYPNEMTQDDPPKPKFPNNLVGFRASYKRRFITCPGVSASDGKALGVSLRITNIDSIKKHEYSSELLKEESNGWEELQQHVDRLNTEWVAPNGDEIDLKMHLWAWKYALEGFGFYNDLYWPHPEKVAVRKGISCMEAQDILERSIYHHTLQQEYFRVLRRWITRRAKKGLDTTFLIGSDMYHHGAKHVGQELFSAWSKMKEADFEGIIKRDKRVVRVCDFRVNKVVEWAKKLHENRPNKSAIVWYSNIGVAEWLKEKFEEAELPMVYCPADKPGKARLEDRTQGDKFAIASLQAYHQGLNLQYHHDMEFFAQWPRIAKWAEQGIGRAHRNEQPSAEVRIFQDIDSEFDRVLLAACLNDAAYTHQTLQRQKLMYADYDERPKILPYSVLAEWGTQPQALGERVRKLLDDKFKGE